MNLEKIILETKIAERALIVYVIESALLDEGFPKDYKIALRDEINNHNLIISEYQEELERIEQARKDKFEGWAKKWESAIPNLAKALRSKDLQNTTADIEDLDGWIRCTTSLPKDGEYVLVTDGEDVWTGILPFDNTTIIAWTYFPSVPLKLKTKQ